MLVDSARVKTNGPKGGYVHIGVKPGANLQPGIALSEGSSLLYVTSQSSFGSNWGEAEYPVLRNSMFKSRHLRLIR